MAPILSLIIAIILGVAAAAHAGQQTRNVLTPTQVSSPSAGPSSTTLPFGVDWPVACPCTLHVVNGAPGSGLRSPTRVWAGWVWVDGTLVLAPSKLSLPNATATATLNLPAGAHEVRLQLIGSSTSFVTVRVAGTISTADLTTARANHTATLMPDGTVLVAGGDGASSVLDSTERVSANGSAVVADAPLATPRAGHSAALVPGRAVIFAGGRDATAALADLEVWTAAAGPDPGLPLDEARGAHTATTLSDGRVLILGGRNGNGDSLNTGLVIDSRPDAFTDDTYNPAAAAITSLGNVLQVPRAGHSATLLADGRVLIVGGRNGGVDLPSIEIVDPASGTSTLLPIALTTARTNHTATLRSNGDVVIIGGRAGSEFLSSVERIRPALDGVETSGSINLARAGHTVTVVRNGEILIAGGMTPSGPTADTEFGPRPPDDTTAPTVVATAPVANATNVERGVVIGIHVSEPVDPDTVNAQTIELRTQSGTLVAASVAIVEQGSLIAVRPDALLAGDTYTVSINGVTDRAGLALSPVSFSFTTIPAPVITALVPSAGAAGAEVTVTGSGFGDDPDDHRLSFGALLVSVVPIGASTLRFIVPASPLGSYPVSLRTRGGVTNAPVAFEIVNPTPSLTAIDPSTVNAGSAGLTLTLTGSSFVDGTAAVVDTTTLSAVFVSATTLQAEVPAALITSPGTLNVHVVNPSPGGGASSDLQLTVQATGPPPSAVTMFPRGMSLSVGGTHQFTAEAHFADGSTSDITSTASWVSSATDVLTVNASGLAGAVADGTSTITVSFGGFSAEARVRVYAGEAIPPDPVDVAPELTSADTTLLSDSTKFLYEGPNAVQRDVTPGAIAALQVAVIRGQVRTQDSQPLSGVRATIKDHPEFGHTLSRLDGAFDMAVNGGGSVVVQFTKDAFLPIERRSVVPSGDFYQLDDVVLIGLDPQVTAIDLSLSTPIAIARGSVMTDQSGSRQATVLFPQGTTAAMVLPDGTTQPLTTLHVRATEYTVGPNGPAAMPGTLPPASGYTYAVELSADEAIAAGATSVQFSAALPVYVENFLGFPAGAVVPVGYYDRTVAAWVPSENGVVLKLLSIAGDGRAEIDLDGDAMPDDATALAQVGMSDAERTTLAATYAAGQSLWRAVVTHFTSYDHNWAVFPLDADQQPTIEPASAGDTPSEADCETPGSIIECQDQVLGQRLPITGTAFTLNYRSDRVPGRQAHRLSIPLTEATIPASLQRIELEVEVAGRRFTQSFPAVAGQVAEFTWDGRDAYGRRVSGLQPAQVEIRHLYNVVYVTRSYAAALASGTAVFGLPIPPGIDSEIRPGRELMPVRILSTVPVGPPPASSMPVAGWSIDVHHTFLAESQTLLFGDGRQRTHAGGGVTPVDLPDVEFFHRKVAAAGAVYYTENTGAGGVAVFRKAPNTPPIEVGAVPFTVDFVVDPDGIVYYAVCEVPEAVTVFRLAPGVPASAVATGGLPAGERCEGTFIARAQDGSLFVDTTTEVFQTLPGGPLVAIGGIHDASSLAVGPDGSVYRGVQMPSTPTTLGMAVEQLDPTGAITVIAGGKRNASGLGGGSPAIDAQFGGILDLAVSNDGSVLVASLLSGVYRLQQVTPAGRLFTIAGGVAATPCCLPSPPPILLADGTPATSVREFEQIEAGDDGWVYLFGAFTYRFRPVLADEVTRIAADDGSEMYEFDRTGRHVRTVDALTGSARYTFAYDPAGRLTAIADGDGLMTQIERDLAGAPTAMVAPFGQRTTLTVDGDGWLATIVAPGDRITLLTSRPSGLLTALVDPNGHPHSFTYDETGRLIFDAGPAGGSETLARTILPGGGWEATRTTAMGRVRRYRTDILPATGAQLLTVTEADGTTSTLTSFPNRRRESLTADGMRTTVTMVPDPRFGTHAPIPQTVTLRSPAGRVMTTARTRRVTLPNPDDLSTLVQTDETRVNTRLWRTVYTGATRTIRTTSAAGRVTTSTLDAQGRVTRTQVGTLTPIDFTYDPQGRLTATTQGLRVSTIAYDAAGRSSLLTDALTRTVEFGYDAADRVTTQTSPDTRTIGFGYDDNGNVTALTPPGRPAHSFTYTPIDFTSSYTPPVVAGTGPTGYLFNADRQPTEVQRPDGQTTVFSYGATNGRLNSITFSRGTMNYGYDTVGRMTSLSDPGGVNLTFTYDGALPLRETWSGAIAGSVSHTFDNDFGIATEQVNNLFNVTFSYDADRLLTGAGVLTIARHPQNGLVIGTALGATTETHEYNDFGEPSRQTAVAAATQVFDVQITRDDLGRITQRIEVVDGITRVFQYGYDLAGRLENVTRNGDLVAHYTYDANGNRLTAEGEADGGGVPIVATYDDQDRLLTYGAATYTYTANGELATKTIGGQTTSYSYDTLGNLIQVTKPNGDVITYTIDGRGRRVGKSINGLRVKGWLYAYQLRPIAELTGSGAVLSRFVYGTKPNVPEYMIRGGVTYRIVSDQLGSPRVVVNAATGEIVQRLDFHAFGEIIQDSNSGWQPFGFAGGLYDPDTNLVRFGARDYDSQVGRWTAKDPSARGGGDSNLYAYVANEPLQWRDANGREMIGSVGGMLIGAVSGWAGANASGGTAIEQFAGAFVGAVSGFAIGALDPSGGILTASTIARTAAINGGIGLWSDFMGQAVTAPPCINVGSMIGAGLGGALGGVMGKILSAAPAVQEATKGLLNNAVGPWAAQWINAIGMAPAALGEAIGDHMWRQQR